MIAASPMANDPERLQVGRMDCVCLWVFVPDLRTNICFRAVPIGLGQACKACQGCCGGGSFLGVDRSFRVLTIRPTCLEPDTSVDLSE